MIAGRTLGIAGVGLIGASIGLAATAAGYDVVGWDPSAAHLAAARVRGAIGAVAPGASALGDRVETLVIAAPVDATIALLRAYVAAPPRASLVIDVASVKAPIARAGAELRAFVATHPIAGSERSGPEAADAVLFRDRTWTYDAGADATPALAARARAFITSLGARPIAIACDEHDRVVALTSHLPQVLAVALGARLNDHLDDARVADLCGTGIASMLRLGGSSWRVWEAILSTNARPIAQELRSFATLLFSLAENLDAGRMDAWAERFAASGSAVARLYGNGTPVELVDRSKPVTDER